MDLKTFVTEKSSVKGLAAQLGIPSPLLSQWANEVRQVPAERCPAIEKATEGAVTCEELRPDVDWGYLRGKPTVEARA